MRTFRCSERLGLATAVALATVILQTGAAAAADPVCGDMNKSGTVNAADALLVLKKGVGQEVTLQCAPPSQILQTGQMTCWDPADTTDPIDSIPCSGSGQDAETPRGLAASFTDNGDGTISESKTGLMWEKLDDSNLAGLAGIHDWNNPYTWAEAFDKIAELNASMFAGYSDWRLPNLSELESLADVRGHVPAIDGKFNVGCVAGCTIATCSCTKTSGYWTSSSHQGNPKFGWRILFDIGSANVELKTTPYFVRGVRGGA